MTVPAPHPPRRRLALRLDAWLFAGALVLWGLGPAQAQLSDEAQAALNRGQQAASAALATYDSHFLDRPLWREAIENGNEAVRLAPERPEPHRFLGQVYTVVKWYSRAWQSWQTYLDLGGPLNAQTNRYIEEAAAWLGFNSFNQQNYREAIRYYGALHTVNSANEDANYHLARAHLALDDPASAQPFLSRLIALAPQDARYAGLLEQANEELRVGVAASRAYREGQAHYAAGRLADALLAFRGATEANPDFREALLMAGRTSLELRRPDEAYGYYQRAVALNPNDGQTQQQLTLAKNQRDWGVEAYAAYQRGVSAYTAGQTSAARSAFLQATSLNTRYGDAWGWLGRIALEAESFVEAAQAYDRARALMPSSSQYQAGYEAANQAVAALEAAALERSQAEEAARQAQLEAERRVQEAAQQAAEREAAAREAATQEAAAREAAAQVAAEREAAAQDAAAREAAAQEAAREAAEREATAQIAAAQTPPAEAAPAEPEPAQATLPDPPPTAPASDTPAPPPVETAAPLPSPDTQASTAPAASVPAPQGAPPVTLLQVNHTHRPSSSATGGAYSFFDVPQSLGSDLRAPVDYAGGTVFQRLEVFSKPSPAPVQVQLCLVPDDDIVVKPACSTAPLTVSTPGVYEARQALTSFSEYGSIDWTKGLVNVMLVLKDGEGRPLDNSYTLGRAGDALELSDYYPMSVRFEAVIVPVGGTFRGW